jgi:hypothetical protein
MGNDLQERIEKNNMAQEKKLPTGKLGEAYILLGKGLPLGQIANELRVQESQLRELLKVKW